MTRVVSSGGWQGGGQHVTGCVVSGGARGLEGVRRGRKGTEVASPVRSVWGSRWSALEYGNLMTSFGRYFTDPPPERRLLQRLSLSLSIPLGCIINGNRQPGIHYTLYSPQCNGYPWLCDWSYVLRPVDVRRSNVVTSAGTILILC